MFKFFKKKEVKVSKIGNEEEKSLSLVKVEGKEREAN